VRSASEQDPHTRVHARQLTTMPERLRQGFELSRFAERLREGCDAVRA